MFIPFDTIPAGSRIWIYQADRKLNEDEVAHILSDSKSFLEGWAAHGNQLQSSATIFHKQFLILTVNEGFNLPSGCSIDSSVHFIQSLEQKFNINFFDRSKVAFVINNEVYLESLPNIKKKIAEGYIKEDTLTFNNLVDKKADLESNWMIPAKKSWMNRFF